MEKHGKHHHHLSTTLLFFFGGDEKNGSCALVAIYADGLYVLKITKSVPTPTCVACSVVKNVS